MSEPLRVPAKCCNPKRSGCCWSGYISIDVAKATCDPCPDCGGYEFTVRTIVERKNWKGVLAGRTS